VTSDSNPWRFEDLEVFKRAYAISLEVHKASLDFPKIEQFGGLADQMRRASKSVCGLIAEGAGRQRGSTGEFKRYCVMALGSADEVQVWCLYVRDLGYVDAETIARWRFEYQGIAKMLRGLITRLEQSAFPTTDNR
jgi:four helix bundle protein